MQASTVMEAFTAALLASTASAAADGAFMQGRPTPMRAAGAGCLAVTGWCASGSAEACRRQGAA
jgi:hypothetical protein